MSLLESTLPEKIQEAFNNAISEFPNINVDIYKIFAFNKVNPSFFPSINGAQSIQDYIYKWINKYHLADCNPPSSRTAKPSTAPPDYLVNKMVQVHLGLTPQEISDIDNYHRLCMQAEGIQGGLLEEYINLNTSSNWIWCKGETVKSVDFYNPTTGVLLQVKNKYNTENSSSSKIRVGTDVSKWNRINKKTVKKEPIAVFNWDDLNAIVSGNMSEQSYEAFVIKCIQSNPNLLLK